MIEPVEALLAVIGVRPIISRTVERVTRGRLREAAELGSRVTRLARQVVRGELVHVPLGDLRYAATLKDLSEEYTPEQVEQMVSRFPHDARDMAGDFIVRAGHVFAQLQAMLPRSAYVTFAGSADLRPSTMAVRKFVAVLEVLDDPMRVFPLICAGALLRSQAEAVRQVFPSLAAAVDEALVAATVAEKTRRKAFQLPPRAEVGVRIWFGQPQTSEALSRALQASYAAERERKASAPAPRRGSIMARETLSAAQRALYPDAGR